MSVEIKICGINTFEALDAARAAGADLVGFVAFPRSPRHLSDEAMAANPVYAGLPAVQAGQVVGWDDKRPFTWASYVEWCDELIAVLDDAEVVSGPPAS